MLTKVSIFLSPIFPLPPIAPSLISLLLTIRSEDVRLVVGGVDCEKGGGTRPEDVEELTAKKAEERDWELTAKEVEERDRKLTAKEVEERDRKMFVWL